MPSSCPAEPEQLIVYVVDDDPRFRRMLASLLRSVQLCVETFASGSEFLANFDAGRAGCLVTDVRMPGMSGLELQERLAAVHAPLPVILMTAYPEVSLAVRAVKAGAVDFVEKPFSPQELLDRIQHALQENFRYRRQQAEGARIKARLESLSPRERQLLNLLVAGKTTKEIARHLQVSLSTVDFHKRNVLEKMGADNVVKLVRHIDHYLLCHPERASEFPNLDESP